MKKTILLFSLVFVSLLTFAQSSNLIIFSENGERFSVVLNGILQNAQPETNVMVQGLIAPTYQGKIIFENPQIPELTKTIFLNESNVQLTLKVKQNKKGKYVLRMFNTVPLAQAPSRPPQQQVVMYTTTPAIATSVTHTTSTTSVHGNGDPTGENVNMNVNMGGVNMNVNMNATGTSSSSYTETHTTSTTTTNTGGMNTNQTSSYVLPGYSGPYGCPYPMSQNDFENAKRSISSKDFSDSKLKLAKQIIDSNCLLSSQVRQMMELFDFESDKLNLAKYAFGYTLDYRNYYQVNDAFEFESSIDDLDDYMRSFRR